MPDGERKPLFLLPHRKSEELMSFIGKIPVWKFTLRKSVRITGISGDGDD
jgi:hypothetical protein